MGRSLMPPSRRQLSVSRNSAHHPLCPGSATDPSSYRHIRNLICFQRVGGPLMLNLTRNPRGFGVDDKPRCTNCGALTFLTRRSPAAEQALAYERQTFTCPGCGQDFERIVDAEGKPVEVADSGVS